MKFSFVKQVAAVAATCAIALTVVSADAEAKKVRWKMHSAFGTNLAVIGPVGPRISGMIKDMSDGDFDVKVFEPGALAGGYAYYDPVS
ncbi:MAG: C4-dicarboxylate ABC transporter, partial [Pseudomonadota bacterium]|nr:C4-dicarboxylate ABC transporter [Pseudomonadota bacterium]